MNSEAERMPWEVGPLSPPRPVKLPVWWRTFPSEFTTLEVQGLGHWDGECFQITPPASQPVSYRYIGEFGKGEALMRLDVVPPDNIIRLVAHRGH